MVSIFSYIYRGKIVESSHEAICVVKNTRNNIILSSRNNNQLIYPRSSIKIFQALPFINSNAHQIFNLNNKHIAISCASHQGEKKHIQVLMDWIKKIKINTNQLKCGIHNPLNEKSSDDLLLGGAKSNQLHNNCAGKHLAMISGCIANKMSINNYTDYNHPYQKLIRDSLEIFTESKILEKCIAVDGCSAPQYAFPINNLATSMVNLIKEKNKSNKYSRAIKTILPCINNYPYLIGGNNQFDSEVINGTKGKIFVKGGAEGVLLFADFFNEVGGVIKIIDGNNRALPSIAMKIFKKLSLLDKYQKNILNKWTNQKLFNHDKKQVGNITAELL